VNTLTAAEAAYIAGLIDGEGTISLSKKHRLDTRQLVISISSTEGNILTYVKEAVGAGKITRKRTYRTGHTPSLTYVITNRQALSLLEQLAAYLKSYKAERAALILEHYLRLTPRNGRYSPQQLEEGETFIQRFLLLRPS
jgi:LAGLIDADG-like domain